MSDELKGQPDEIQDILAELDSILSGLGGAGVAPAAKPSAEPPVLPPIVKAAPLLPAQPPKPVASPPSPALPPVVKAASLLPAQPPKPVAPSPSPALPPVAKAAPIPPPGPPKAAAPPPPPAAAGPLAPGSPAPISEEVPATTPKDQIRRVAYIYTFAGQEARTALSAFLSQAARTISKKPLFLRQVLSIEVGAQSDPEAVYQKAREARAVFLLAVVEGWPAAKVEALSEACARGGLLFRYVPSGDVQKKSTAVDVIVDMMLLPGES